MDKHDQHCPRKHAVAGLCDCTHFKCINCHKMGHNSRDIRCPARELYWLRTIHKGAKTRDKGKERAMKPTIKQVEETVTSMESTLQSPTPTPPGALNKDPFNPLPPPVPTPPEALNEDPFNHPLPPIGRDTQPMEWDYTCFEPVGGDWDAPYADPYERWTRDFLPPQTHNYSPSHSQSGATPTNLA